MHGPADVVQFNTQLSGTVAADFAFSGALIDISSSQPFTRDFAGYPKAPSPLFQFPLPPSTTPPPPFGGDIGFLVRIAGATPSDVGSYTLDINPPYYRR